jgi:hypothetical protein
VQHTDSPSIHTTCLPPPFRLQYFWEAFPAGSGPSDRTSYMFTYMDAQPWRPSLAQLFDDYWQLMPQYQVMGAARCPLPAACCLRLS